jgi:undecaprenyl diphosphate synthase
MSNFPLLEPRLDPAKIPHHSAIIMDGNRRWAKANGVHYLRGHKKGVENLTLIVEAAALLGVKVLTVYAFSTENWNRSKTEIAALMKLFESYLLTHSKILMKQKVRLKVIGDLSRCPLSLQRMLAKTILATEKNDKIELVLAINYGGRDEIKRAVQKILSDYDKKLIDKESVSEDLVSSYLDTSFCPDPDLVIRTSGELRLSNFMLWQMSYAEFYSVDVLWPDFSKEHLVEAILGYQKRERRFGGK